VNGLLITEMSSIWYGRGYHREETDTSVAREIQGQRIYGGTERFEDADSCRPGNRVVSRDASEAGVQAVHVTYAHHVRGLATSEDRGSLPELLSCRASMLITGLPYLTLPLDGHVVTHSLLDRTSTRRARYVAIEATGITELLRAGWNQGSRPKE
jgi:hypothetical protein